MGTTIHFRLASPLNTLTENRIHSQKTEYTHRKQNTLAENRIHSQKTEYTRREQNTLAENRLRFHTTVANTVCTEIAYRNLCIKPYLLSNMIEGGLIERGAYFKYIHQACLPVRFFFICHVKLEFNRGAFKL